MFIRLKALGWRSRLKKFQPLPALHFLRAPLSLPPLMKRGTHGGRWKPFLATPPPPSPYEGEGNEPGKEQSMVDKILPCPPLRKEGVR